MKVAILSESPADEEGVHILAEAVLGVPIEVTRRKARTGGVDAVLRILPAVMKEVYYHSDAAGLIAVVDSDQTVAHFPQHEVAGQAVANCRLCELQQLVSRTRSSLAMVEGRGPLHSAVGLAIPSLEAWCLCGEDHSVSEATWNNARKHNQFPYRPATLKQRLYGSERPSLDREVQVIRAAMERIVATGSLALLEQLFDGGFGSLARQLRTWQATTE
ncbi:MAG TPA: hypothetical protein VMP01_04380 [Pirellulaceae bacterium]|nr:hypothetical protein [Pirellulaceae bacterium]